MSNDIYGVFTEEELKNEEWRDVVGYAGLYQVSNLGRVKSLPRIYFTGKGHTTKIVTGEKILKQTGDTKGYLRISLCKDSIVGNFTVHRIVAVAFCDNKNNYPVVNHLDSNPSNNRRENLEFCSYSDNSKHIFKSGRGDNIINLIKVKSTGANNVKAKLSDDEVLRLKKLYFGSDLTQSEVAEIFNISESQVGRITRGEQRKSPTPVLEKH